MMCDTPAPWQNELDLAVSHKSAGGPVLTESSGDAPLLLPIRDWWAFHLNNGDWLIWTQAWAVFAKDWDIAFFQWRIAWNVCKKVGVSNCWDFLHSRNASFDGGGTMWRCNRIRPDMSKRRLLWINGYFRWYFIIVGVEQIVHFPPKIKMSRKEKVGECWMDVRYRTSGGVV